jgi:hypothetical protein
MVNLFNDPIGANTENGHYLALGVEFPRKATLLRAAARLSKPDFITPTAYTDDDSVFIEDFSLTDITRGPANGLRCPPDATHPEGQQKMANAFHYIMRGGGQEVVAEFKPKEGAVNSGYYFDMMQAYGSMFYARFKNLNDKKQEIFLRIEVDYIDGRNETLKEAETNILPLDLCNEVSISPNTPEVGAKQNARLKNITSEVEMDGWLVSLTGFMEQGGSEMNIELNGKNVCTLKALYGGLGGVSKQDDGTVDDIIREMTYCPPIKVQKGDRLFTEAKYDFDIHPM